MRYRIPALLGALVLLAGCGGTFKPAHTTNSALDFLYPGGMNVAMPPSQVTLKLPLRVGLAFAPNRSHLPDPITEGQKQVLLTRVADAFKEHKAIGNLQVVPAAYLQPNGSFGNLEQLRASLGLDLMVLLSYDQAQFTERTRASWTYLTIIGPMLIQGEKNDTRTVVDAVVYDIPSRALLFRAAGESTVKGRSSPLNVQNKRRKFAANGFGKATDSLITNLTASLNRFEEQARNGTVQGPGTPAIAMYNPQGERITSSGGGGWGGGAISYFALFPLAMVILALLWKRSCVSRG